MPFRSDVVERDNEIAKTLEEHGLILFLSDDSIILFPNRDDNGDIRSI